MGKIIASGPLMSLSDANKKVKEVKAANPGKQVKHTWKNVGGKRVYHVEIG